MTKGMYSSITDLSEKNSYLVPNQDLRGVGQPYVKASGFLEASAAVDPTVLTGSGIQLAAIPSPITGKYIHLPDGNVSAPGLAWQGEVTSGLYRIGAANFGQSVLGTLKWDWNATRLNIDSGYFLDVADMTNGSVLFAGNSTGRVSQDNANLFWDAPGARLGLGCTDPFYRLEVRHSSLPQMLLSSDDNNATIFQAGGSGMVVTGYTTTWGGLPFFSVQCDVPGIVAEMSIYNTHSSGVSSAKMLVQVDSGSTGDAYYQLYNGTTIWSFGLDNSDSDKWKLSKSATLGTTDYLTVYTTGDIAFGTGSLYWDNATTTGRPSLTLGNGTTNNARIQARYVGDGMTSGLSASIAGDGWLRLYGHSANEFFDLAHYEFGALLSFANTRGSGGLAALEIWGKCNSSYQPVVTFIVGNTGGGPAYSESDFRNPGDTGSWGIIHYANGPEFYTNGIPTEVKIGIGSTPDWRYTTGAVDLAASSSLRWLNGALVSGSVTTATADLAIGRNAASVMKMTDGTNIHNIFSCAAATATVFNETGADIDHRMEGDTAVNLFFLDASADFIGINTSGPDRRLDILDSSNPQLRLTHTDGSVYMDIQATSSGNGIFTTTSTSNPDVAHSRSIASQVVQMSSVNNDNTSVSSHARLSAVVGGSSGGDPITTYTVSGIISWTHGLDNDNNDAFTLCDNSASITTNAARLTIYNNSEMVINENQRDVDLRVEGDSISHLFFLDATATTENCALFAAAAPNWQTMDRGFFIGNCTTVPTGNPASGHFYYDNAGTPTWRSSGGAIMNLSQATGGQNVTNNVTDTASTNGTIPDITNGTVYATDYTNLRNALFQLARMLKQDHDQLRAMGILT